MADRMPTELFVSGNIRACSSQNIPVYVMRRGDPQSGIVVLKIVKRDRTCDVYSQMRDMDGALKWYNRTASGSLAERDADEQINRMAEQDPDIWCVEIESASGENPFDGEELSL